jgi:hypothetical protein
MLQNKLAYEVLGGIAFSCGTLKTELDRHLVTRSLTLSDPLQRDWGWDGKRLKDSVVFS